MGQWVSHRCALATTFSFMWLLRFCAQVPIATQHLPSEPLELISGSAQEGMHLSKKCVFIVEFVSLCWHVCCHVLLVRPGVVMVSFDFPDSKPLERQLFSSVFFYIALCV